MKKQISKKTIVITGISIIFIGLLVFHGLNKRANSQKNESSQVMADIIRELSEAISQEEIFFESEFSFEEYEIFIHTLDKDFEMLEQEFSQVHSDVVEDMNEEQKKLVDLFVQLLDYHYMLLKNHIAFAEFEQAVNELTGFIESGRLTSNEYNTELEVLMQDYGDLMNYSALIDAETRGYEDDDDELKRVMSQLQAVQEELSQMEVTSEEDQYVHKRVVRMFTSVEQGIASIEAYAYKDALHQINHDGLVNYTNMQLSEIMD
jgi:chaperonin cofactor prefoldin